jgi:hypothetical protein
VGGWLLNSSDSGDLSCFDFEELIKTNEIENNHSSVARLNQHSGGKVVQQLWNLYHNIDVNRILSRKVCLFCCLALATLYFLTSTHINTFFDTLSDIYGIVFVGMWLTHTHTCLYVNNNNLNIYNI